MNIKMRYFGTLAVLAILLFSLIGCGGEGTTVAGKGDGVKSSPLTGAWEGFYGPRYEHPRMPGSDGGPGPSSDEWWGQFSVVIGRDGTVHENGVWIGSLGGKTLFGGRINGGKSADYAFGLVVEVTHKLDDDTFEWIRLGAARKLVIQGEVRESGTWYEGPGTVSEGRTPKQDVEVSMYYMPHPDSAAGEKTVAAASKAVGRPIPPLPTN